MSTISEHRTIRRYSGRDIAPELLSRLLEEAGRTQTMGNLQLYSVVVTRSAEGKAALSPLHFAQPMVTEAAVVLTVCADFRRTSRWAECRRATPGYDNALSCLNAMTDALLYTQTLSIVAEREGLGVCFLGTTIYQPLSIIKALRLPRLVFPVATLTMGWPAEEPPLSDRLPVGAYVHEEVYHDPTEADIDAYYGAKEALEVNREFVRINGKETLAQVFTDLRYTRKDNEAMSRTLIEALRHQGFIE